MPRNSSPAVCPRSWGASCSQTASQVPAFETQDVQDCLKVHEEAGTTKSQEYNAAMNVFWETFACRVKPFPEEVVHPLSMANNGTRIDAARPDRLA